MAPLAKVRSDGGGSSSFEAPVHVARPTAYRVSDLLTGKNPTGRESESISDYFA